jgi:hypothetical protein
MNRLACCILLEDENARSFAELGVILNKDRKSDAMKDVGGQNIIVRQFIIAVIRDTNFALCHKYLLIPPAPTAFRR